MDPVNMEQNGFYEARSARRVEIVKGTGLLKAAMVSRPIFGLPHSNASWSGLARPIKQLIAFQ